MRFVIWFIKRDALFSRHSLFFLLLISGFFLLMLGWYAFNQTPLPSLSANWKKLSTPTASFAVDFWTLCAMTLLCGIFIVGMSVQTEKANGSFRTLLALPLSREHLFWGRILSAALWAATPLAFGYIGLWSLQYLGFFGDDPLIALIAGFKFFALLLAIDLLLAVILIGVSLLGDARFILIVLLASLLTPWMVVHIALNPMITGLSKWSVLPEVIKVLSRMSNLVFLIVTLALLVGFAMSTIFKLKRSYL